MVAKLSAEVVLWLASIFPFQAKIKLCACGGRAVGKGDIASASGRDVASDNRDKKFESCVLHKLFHPHCSTNHMHCCIVEAILEKYRKKYTTGVIVRTDPQLEKPLALKRGQCCNSCYWEISKLDLILQCVRKKYEINVGLATFNQFAVLFKVNVFQLKIHRWHFLERLPGWQTERKQVEIWER